MNVRNLFKKKKGWTLFIVAEK